MLYIAGKRGLPRRFARFVLFRQTKKRSFNLLCVLDLFFRTLAVYSVSDSLNVSPCYGLRGGPYVRHQDILSQPLCQIEHQHFRKMHQKVTSEGEVSVGGPHDMESFV